MFVLSSDNDQSFRFRPRLGVTKLWYFRSSLVLHLLHVFCCNPILYIQGQENCLEGLTFVITGVLESMERDEAKSLLERYGGKVTGGISKKTSYMVLGRDGGESKTAKVFIPIFRKFIIYFRLRNS